MKVVMKFAKLGNGDKETVREKVVPVRTFGTAHFNWHEIVAAAIFHTQPGERIVSISEEGYQ